MAKTSTMIEFRKKYPNRKKSKHVKHRWYPIRAVHLPNEYSFNDLDLRIDGKIYTKDSLELRSIVEKIALWERLNRMEFK